VKTSDFSFDVPEELIAQRPPERRGTSRLMVVRRASGSLADASVSDLPALLPAGTLVVLNDTRVIKARLLARSPTSGAGVEVLLLHPAAGSPADDAPVWETLVSNARRRRVGQRLLFPEGRVGTIVAAGAETRAIAFDPPIDPGYLERNGHVPLPPYIRRADDASDGERYQTVFARTPGSVAAPTAGLHLTEEMLAGLSVRGLQIAPLTLHVGLGTFAPIRAESIEDHRMHEESFGVPEESARAVNAALDDRRTVLAVGTTVVRALESAAADGRVRGGWRATGLFITPGYRFRAVSALLTNFHTPRSSLFVLVSAFAGLQLMRRAYERAVKERYRFFSYGDAMLIL
jgi:S-adenosylmethionine:tRNA ribosyltransferase-isomerase